MELEDECLLPGWGTPVPAGRGQRVRRLDVPGPTVVVGRAPSHLIPAPLTLCDAIGLIPEEPSSVQTESLEKSLSAYLMSSSFPSFRDGRQISGARVCERAGRFLKLIIQETRPPPAAARTSSGCDRM